MELEATEASVRNHVMADVKHNSEEFPFSMELRCISAPRKKKRKAMQEPHLSIYLSI
ncbi:unnamed protein product [Brassica rapa]|uniref:Uncharacterized protein n=1 Tax=Brassica campestris TaxID=3711 RepID=A0A3P5YFV9_BRACM|nr:unnamed protein product [Brassica rapa]VDC62554.1 unnamed protein product [Brassica rapa]